MAGWRIGVCWCVLSMLSCLGSEKKVPKSYIEMEMRVERAQHNLGLLSLMAGCLSQRSGGHLLVDETGRGQRADGL